MASAMTDDEARARLHYQVIHSHMMRLATILDRNTMTTAHLRLLMAGAALEDSEDAFTESAGCLRMIEDAYAIGEDGI